MFLAGEAFQHVSFLPIVYIPAFQKFSPCSCSSPHTSCPLGADVSPCLPDVSFGFQNLVHSQPSFAPATHSSSPVPALLQLLIPKPASPDQIQGTRFHVNLHANMAAALCAELSIFSWQSNFVLCGFCLLSFTHSSLDFPQDFVLDILSSVQTLSQNGLFLF